MFCVSLLFCLLVNSVVHGATVHSCLLVLLGFIGIVLECCYGLLCLVWFGGLLIFAFVDVFDLYGCGFGGSTCA